MSEIVMRKIPVVILIWFNSCDFDLFSVFHWGHVRPELLMI